MNRKKIVTNIIFGLSLAVFFSACSTNKNAITADIFAPISQQQFETIDAMIGQKSVYEAAYAKAKTYFAPENPVRGAVIAATLKNKEELAGFFQRLQNQQNYQTIVLLSSADFGGAANPKTPASQTQISAADSQALIKTQTQANTQVSNSSAIAGISNYAYKTSYGILAPPGNFFQNDPESDFLKPDEANIIAKKEAWSKTIAPFIAKTFPNTKVLTVFVNQNNTPADDQKLAVWLSTSLPQDSLVLAQATSKTSPDQNVAEFQLKFTENVLENFDETNLQTLPFNDSNSANILERYLFQRHAQHVQNQFMDPQTGGLISFSMDGPLIQSRNVFLVSFGDIMLDRVVRQLMDSNGLDYPFQKMDQTYLKNNDILLANLEGPIAKKRVQTSKEIAFRFAPDVIPLLQKYFFDALSQANNHAMDMGVTGYDDTFDLMAQTGIKVFGDPRQIDDRSVAKFDIDGQKIAFLGLEEVVYKIDDAKAVATIKDLTTQGYKVIPFMHWGIEYKHTPNDRQQQLAHEFIDAGAYAVIGCHPHVVETFETYKNHPIFYSLGNGIFDQYFSPDTQEGLSTAMILSNDQIQIYFLPIKIDKSQFRLMTQEERIAFLQRFVTYGDYQTEAERLDIANGKLTIKL